MTATLNNNIRVFSAEQFAGSLAEKNVYLAISRAEPWYAEWQDAIEYTVGQIVEYPLNSNNYYECQITHTGDNLGNNAPNVDAVNWAAYVVARTNSPESAKNTLVDMIAAKKLSSVDSSLVIPRVDWTAGTVYDGFDPSVENFAYANDFYVLNSVANIYKCVYSPGTQATVEPTGTSATTYDSTGDGYLWKYMGNVTPNDAVKFLSSDYIPVKLLESDNGSIQWDVQQAALSNSLSIVKLDNTPAAATFIAGTYPLVISAPDIAGGVQAAGQYTIDGSGNVTSVGLTTFGTGYTAAPTITAGPHDATIAADGLGTWTTEPVFSAVMAPKDGHGYDITRELNARYVMVSGRFDDSDLAFPQTDDFREISLVTDMLNTLDTLATGVNMYGYAHPDYDAQNASSKVKPLTGEVLYTEVVNSVQRQAGQIEEIKLVLKF